MFLAIHPIAVLILLAAIDICSLAYRFPRAEVASRVRVPSLREKPLSTLHPRPVIPSSLENRTITCLDFTCVLDELRNVAVTVLGKERIASMHSSDAAQVAMNYAMVEQVTNELGLLPLRSSMNVWPVLRKLEVIGSPPDKDELVEFAALLQEVNDIHVYVTQSKSLSLFDMLAQEMKLPGELLSIFQDAFDDEGELSAEKYPSIGAFRREASVLKGKIANILNGLLRSNDMREKIADQGFEEIDGRYCLMLKNTYKKGVGIVHGSSNTGRTLYVEPMEVIEPTNELKSIYASIRAEENNIYFEMCKSISSNREFIKTAVKAVAELDGYRAKAILGKKLKGVIPEIGNQGEMRCIDAKHPVLALRGIEPVGNSIKLDSTCKSLVISGPNAGGKTIVLKTAGLFALMAKHAIPLPAKSGAKIDIFNVMADIGDMQTVSGDLSTFSGHLVICREMLCSAREVRSRGEYSLVLLDEIGTGTDPAQGAALAQAVLEDLVAAEAKVIVTTHYQRIKELAAQNEKFQIAAMEFVNNRPTYRLRMGSIGESFALEAARRMNLPENVLERANSLLDNESKRLLALQQKLEEETEKARVRQVELDRINEEMRRKSEEMDKEKQELKDQIQMVKDGKIDDFLDDIRERERELEMLIRKAQSIVEASPETILSDQKSKERQIEDIKSSVKKMRLETEKAVVETAAEDIATPLTPGEPIEEGRTLIILDKGNLFGSRAIVSKRNKGTGKVVLRVAGAEIKMERHLLGTPLRMGLLSSSRGFFDEDEPKDVSAKEKRLLKMLEEDLVDPDKLAKGLSVGGKNRKLSGLRIASNTVDVRGITLSESQSIVEGFLQDFVDQTDINSGNVMYVNHGNSKSTDSVKAKLRLWLQTYPLVKRARAAELSDGGDAFTVVELDLQ